MGGPNKSAITDHVLEQNRVIEWDKAKIKTDNKTNEVMHLDKESRDRQDPIYDHFLQRPTAPPTELNTKSGNVSQFDCHFR